MIKVIDLENVEFSPKHGHYTGNTSCKDGIIYNNELWIVKYFSYAKEFKEEHNKLEYSIPALSEFITSHIFEILGYPVQDTMLAKRYNSLVVVCKDFTEEKDLIETYNLWSTSDEILKSEYKTIQYTNIIQDNLINSYIFHLKHNPNFYNVDGMTERFWEQSIIDVFINNSDRCDKNWGVLKDKEGNTILAPMFDNGNGLELPSEEDKVKELLSNDELLYRTVLSTISTYLAIRYTECYISNEDLRKAVLKVIPLIESRIDNIFKFIDSIPNYQEFENGTLLNVCSTPRKELYKKILKIRFEVLLKPLYEVAYNYKSDEVTYE